LNYIIICNYDKAVQNNSFLTLVYLHRTVKSQEEIARANISDSLIIDSGQL